jgi:hypothetical protein
MDMLPFDPIAWARGNGVAPQRAAAALADLLLQADVSSETRQQALRAASDGSADALRRALQMLCHCPEFQLA